MASRRVGTRQWGNNLAGNEERGTRIFFVNMSSWGPTAETFLDGNRSDKYHIVSFAESHLDAKGVKRVRGQAATWGRRVFASCARPTGRSERGTSGGTVIAPGLRLELDKS